MDKIILKNMQFYGYHGVHVEEKKMGQRFIISVKLFLDLKNPGNSDCLNDTVSYSLVYSIVKDITENSSFNLLEALAEKICKSILNEFANIKEVLVKVKKPSVPIKGILDYAAVEIRRKRDE